MLMRILFWQTHGSSGKMAHLERAWELCATPPYFALLISPSLPCGLYPFIIKRQSSNCFPEFCEPQINPIKGGDYGIV